MIGFTRRDLLAGAAVATTATALAASTVGAATPAGGPQVPGYYRYKVGALEVTTLHDGARTFPVPDSFVANIKKEEVLAALAATYAAPKGQVTIPYNPVVINTGLRLILIDAGCGAGTASAGQLVTNLAAAGIDAGLIGTVILSHLHTDHINGLRTADGALAFPNAEIKAPALELAFWLDDANMAKATDPVTKAYFDNVRKVFSPIANRITRYEFGDEVAPGITALDARGHSPGHTAFVIASGSSQILVQSDVTNIPQLFLVNPDWHVMYDHDAEMAQKTRHRIYDMAAADHLTIVGYHFPFPSVGHIEKAGSHYRLIPINWSAVL